MSKDHDYKTVSHDELEKALRELPDWGIKSGKLYGLFSFDDFRAAFGFITAVAFAADKLDHHPDWSNSYDKVSIELITHQTESITDLDLKLAKEISDLYSSMG